MIDTLHRNYEMHEGTTGLLARVGHGIGYAASLGVGLAKAAVEGLPELFDPDISILRRHHDPQSPPTTQAHFN